MESMDEQQATAEAKRLMEQGYEYTVSFGCNALYELLPEGNRTLGPRWYNYIDSPGGWLLEAGSGGDGPCHWIKSPFPGIKVEEIQKKAEEIYEQQGGSHIYSLAEFDEERERRKQAVQKALDCFGEINLE